MNIIKSEMMYDPNLEQLMKMINMAPTDYLHTQSKAIEEQVLNGVLRELLQREPTIDDYKKCTIIHQHDDMGNIDYSWYHFAYDGNELGIVRKEFRHNEVIKYIVTFTPKYPK